MTDIETLTDPTPVPDDATGLEPTAETPTPLAPIYLGIPSHDGRVVIESLVELVQVANRVGGLQIEPAEGGNIPRARNAVMDRVYHAAGGTYAIRTQDPNPPAPQWVLWLDSDILIPVGTAPLLADYLNTGRATDRQWLANYHMADGQSVLMKDRTLYGARHYGLDELICLPDWAAVGMGGFGLSFLKMDLTYEFHANAAGEDIHYWLDHPDEKVYVAKQLLLKHRKAVWM